MKHRFSKLFALSFFVLLPLSLDAGDGFVRIQGGQATRDATGQPARLATETSGSGDSRIDTLKTSGGGAGAGGDASAANQVELMAAPSLYRESDQDVVPAEIKGSAGKLHGYSFVNPNAYPVYAKLYDALAADVSVGTTVPIRTIAIPSGGFIIQENAGIALTGFATGITIAVTKLLGDDDTTDVDTGILAEVFYK
jgi:hypothetical protein